MTPNLAVMGAGLIGRAHIARIRAHPKARLTAIIDPSEAGRDVAHACATPWFPDFATMLATHRPDGMVIATPNQLHVEHGLACVAAGIPALIEKPIADAAAAATRLVEAAEAAKIPLLTGHHRRHNPIIAAAKQAIDQGRLGRIITAHTTCWFHKPEAYFAPAWRRAPGAGPVFINLIHDVDLLRHLCGEVTAVQAITSNAARGLAVEDTAVILLRFASGALGTLTVSDTVSAPWSWEFTAGENPAYTHTPELSTMIGGTLGSLSVPRLDLWHHPEAADWFTPLAQARLHVAPADPLMRQIDNFCDVIRGTAAPVVSGREGLRTLEVIVAIHAAASTGTIVSASSGAGRQAPRPGPGACLPPPDAPGPAGVG